MKRNKKFFILVACVLMVSFIFVTTLLAAEQTITGVLEKEDDHFIIKTDEGDYEAEGEDLEEFVGKKVEVTGDVEGMKIEITEIKVAD